MASPPRARSRRIASSCVEDLAEQVRTHEPQVVLPRDILRLQELGDGHVEADRLERVGGDDDAHVAARALPRFAGTIDVPAAVHAHVRPQHEGAVPRRARDA